MNTVTCSILKRVPSSDRNNNNAMINEQSAKCAANQYVKLRYKSGRRT